MITMPILINSAQIWSISQILNMVVVAMEGQVMPSLTSLPSQDKQTNRGPKLQE